MRRILILLGVVLGLAVGAFAVVWLVPSVQDAIIKRGMVGAFTKAANQPFLKDKDLHILLCGTGSPMPDLTRANACAAIIARGKVAEAAGQVALVICQELRRLARPHLKFPAVVGDGATIIGCSSKCATNHELSI